MNLTLRHGMVWYIFSMSIITINDIAAYMCGFFFGTTPLIVLSPKKTVEGYLGGGIVTVLLAPMYANFLQQFSNITCPVSQFTVQPCQVSSFYSGPTSPFVFHCLVISVFARSDITHQKYSASNTIIFQHFRPGGWVFLQWLQEGLQV